MPWRVSAGTMAETAHSFLAQVLFPPDAQNPGVQLRASSHRSNGVPPLIGSLHPACDSTPASGQSECAPAVVVVEAEAEAEAEAGRMVGTEASSARAAPCTVV